MNTTAEPAPWGWGHQRDSMRLSISPDQKQAVSEAARRRSLSMSEYTRKAILEYLRQDGFAGGRK